MIIKAIFVKAESLLTTNQQTKHVNYTKKYLYRCAQQGKQTKLWCFLVTGQQDVLLP